MQYELAEVRKIGPHWNVPQAGINAFYWPVQKD